MSRRPFKIGDRVTHDEAGDGTVIAVSRADVSVSFGPGSPTTFTGAEIAYLEHADPEIVRVLRVIEYVGPRADVEAQVAASLHGERRGHGDCIIKAATIGIYPEVLSGVAG